MSETDLLDYTTITTEIVSAYVSKNPIRTADLPGLIASVHGTVRALRNGQQGEPEKLTPAVPIERSITPDYLVSLEDGKHYKSLKRHLSGRGLTPEQYRQKWGLARDYPMVAANYAKRRSELAKSLGLGRQGRISPPPPASPQPESGKRPGRKRAR